MKTSVKGMVGAALVALLAGCGQAGDDVAIEHVAQWSESSADWVADVRPVAGAVIGSEEELQQWVDAYGSGAGERTFDALEAVDLEESFLVIGGYPRCREGSRVVIVGDSEVRFEVVKADPDVACVWAPYTIAVWAVPLSATGGEVPALVG